MGATNKDLFTLAHWVSSWNPGIEDSHFNKIKQEFKEVLKASNMYSYEDYSNPIISIMRTCVENMELFDYFKKMINEKIQFQKKDFYSFLKDIRKVIYDYRRNLQTTKEAYKNFPVQNQQQEMEKIRDKIKNMQELLKRIKDKMKNNQIKEPNNIIIDYFNNHQGFLKPAVLIKKELLNELKQNKTLNQSSVLESELTGLYQKTPRQLSNNPAWNYFIIRHMAKQQNIPTTRKWKNLALLWIEKFFKDQKISSGLKRQLLQSQLTQLNPDLKLSQLSKKSYKELTNELLNLQK